MADAPPDFAGLHASADFQALFEHKDSAVYQRIEQLKHDLLTRASMTETERIHAQGRLAGMLVVRDLVASMHNRIVNHQPPVTTHRQEPRAELRFLPRRLQGISRTFPRFGGTAQKGN